MRPHQATNDIADTASKTWIMPTPTGITKPNVIHAARETRLAVKSRGRAGMGVILDRGLVSVG